MSKKVNVKSFNSLTQDELVLVNHIKQARAQGMPNHQITLELTNAGWDINSIAAAFQREYLLRSDEQTTQPAKEGNIILSHKTPSMRWSILIRWVIATTLGLIVSDGLSFLLFWPGAVEVILPGAVIGTFQLWLVLRLQLYNAGRWVWFSTIGWIIGWFLGLGIGWLVHLIVSLIIGVNVDSTAVVNTGAWLWGGTAMLIVQGAVIGTVQRWYILDEEFNRTGWWIVATTAGWALANRLGLTLVGHILWNWGIIGLLDSASRGLIFGVITGFALMWLFRQSDAETQAVTAGISSVGRLKQSAKRRFSWKSAKFLAPLIFVFVATICIMAGWLIGTNLGRSNPEIWAETSSLPIDRSSAAGQGGISGGLLGLFLGSFLSFGSFGLVTGWTWRKKYSNMELRHSLLLVLGWMFFPVIILLFMLCAYF